MVWLAAYYKGFAICILPLIQRQCYALTEGLNSF